MIYAKPPIVEAVIEFQFSGSFTAAQRQRVSSKFKKYYPNIEILNELTIQNRPDGMRHDSIEFGLKMSSNDRTEIVCLAGDIASEAPLEPRLAAVYISQLAPYCGWEVFRNRFLSCWSTAEKAIGHRKVERAGVRFINRIDIPGEIGKYSDWVNIIPEMPPNLPGPIQFQMQNLIEVGDARANIIVYTAISPIPKHTSVVLDIDVYNTIVVSDRLDDRIDLINSFRDKKNFIFEQCITDQARELFK